MPPCRSGDGLGYSLLFPLAPLSSGDLVTRDYVEGLERGREGVRPHLLLPWRPRNLMLEQEKQLEPGKEFFLAARTMETLPDLQVEVVPLPGDRRIKVYSEYSFINANLTHPRYHMIQLLSVHT